MRRKRAHLRVVSVLEKRDLLSDELGGSQLRDARIRAGWSNRSDFAERVGVKARTLEGWESSSGHVPPGKLDLVRRALDERRPDPLAAYSDARLVAEITSMVAELARRLSQYTDGSNDDITSLTSGSASIVDLGTNSGSPTSGTGDTTKGPRRVRGRGPR